MNATTSIRVEDVSKRYEIGSVTRLNLSDEIVYHLRRLIGMNPDTLSKVDKVVRDREFWALKDVSFEIKQGEAVALIGANGAGKSTMLKILSRITTPTAGRILVAGRVGTMLEVGTGFHPEMTGRENIFLNGAILGMTRREIEQKFDAIVDFSGVGRFLETPVKRYSSGMYVRLAFAVASHLEPDVLIVDEVLSVGDASFQAKCIDRMKSIASNSRTTVIFVSHSMANVRALCARSIWFEDGCIRMDGGSDEVADSYLQAQAALKAADAPASRIAVQPQPSQAPNVPLRARTDRVGDGRWRAASAAMCYDATSGQWHFSLDYTSQQAEIVGPGLVVGVHREGIPGKCVVVLDSRCMGGLPERIPGKGTIRVALSRDVAFAPGEYSCDLTCKTRDDQTGNDVFSDQVRLAVTFRVDASPVFGWRRLPLTPGLMFVQQEWTVEGAP